MIDEDHQDRAPFCRRFGGDRRPWFGGGDQLQASCRERGSSPGTPARPARHRKPARASERAFTGVISARVQSNLGFRVPGKVVERLVDVGQNVRAGQPLMRLDQTDLDLALTAKENAVAAARALAIQATADEARYRQLAPPAGRLGRDTNRPRPPLDSADAQLAAAEAQADVARNEAAYSLLRADADGTVVETLAEPGQVVAAGQTVVRLAHAGPREATVNLAETMRPAIGSPAQARVYGGIRHAFAGTPSAAVGRRRSRHAEPTRRAMSWMARRRVRRSAQPSPSRWRPAERPKPSEVPLGALYDNGKSSGVWVVDPHSSSVSLRAVQVRRLAEETAIVSGVNAGERVVALGAHLLHQGERVRLADDQRVAAQ